MSSSKIPKTRAIVFLLSMLFSVSLSVTQAQSLDINAPSPVSTNNITGQIAARDIGDARVTEHYYTFAGVPGDLIITIESRNLNGDVDVFTAGTLRPVLKLSLYAEISTPVTKSIYLRQRQELILRIQARSPNDDDGTYQVRFSGSFEAMAPSTEAPAAPVVEIARSQPRDKNVRRVNSAGARIDQPTPPPAVTDSAVITPVEKEETEAEPPPAAPVKPAATTPTGRSGRAPTRTATRTGRKPTVADEAAKTTEPETRTGPLPSERTAKKPTPRRSSRNTNTRSSTRTASGRGAKTPGKTPPPPAPDTSKEPGEATSAIETTESLGPVDQNQSSLIIEFLDGRKLERQMSTVRRVTIESGQIVITGIDGKIERVRLASVTRMFIGQ